MKQNIFRMIKKHGPKTIVFLLLAALIVTFLPPDPGSYAAFSSNQAIASKTGDITAAPAQLANGGVWTGKSVDDSPALDKFNVKLSALGQKFTTTSSTTNKYDVVFVLDKSSSMLTNNKLTNMKTAALSAINTVLGVNNTVPNANRIAVVTFSVNADPLIGWTSGTSLTGSKLTSFNGISSTNQNDSGTNIQDGLYEAKQLFNSLRGGAIPVIILLTDGAPNIYHNGTFDAFTGTGFTNASSANGDDTSAAFSILYANYIKSLSSMTNLKFYTVGFDVAASSRAQSVLNPADGLTIDISNQMSSAKTTANFSPSDYGYTDGYYEATIDNLTTVLASATSNATSNVPITGNLVITDTLGTGFKFTANDNPAPTSIAFTLNGNAKTALYSAGSYIYGPDTDGVSVIFNTSTKQVTYTIPANKLSCLAPDTASTTGANPNYITFDVELDGSAVSGTTYYTNTSASSTFTPESGNPNYASTNPVTINMTQTGSIELGTRIGNLTVKKVNIGGNQDDTFTFQVTLTNANGAGEYEVVKYDAGDAALDEEVNLAGFSLKGGEYIKITGINAGTSYIISESSNNAYTTTASSNISQDASPASGTITGDNTDVVTFTNTYKVTTLTVGKDVDADDQNHNGPFSFNISFQIGQDVYSAITYKTYDPETQQYSGPTSLTDFSFELSDGDYIQFCNIPAGAGYTVTETTNDGGIVSYNKGNGYVSGNTADASDLTTEANVMFKNDYSSSAPLTVTKDVTHTNNSNIPESFVFDIFLYNDELLQAAAAAAAALATAEGDLYDAEAALTAAVQASLGDAYDAETPAIDQLAAAYTAANEAIAAAALTPEDEEDDAAAEAVKNALEDAETAYNNASAALPLAQGDNLAAAEAALAAPHTGLVPNAEQLALGLAPVDGQPGHYTFTLKDDESISFVNLPVGLAYTITEAATDPAAKSTTIDVFVNGSPVNQAAGRTVTGTILWDGVSGNQQDVKVTYTNDYSITLGSLTLTKTFSGLGWQLPDEYTFEVTLNGGEPQSVTLDADNDYTVKFDDLFPGTTYTITETTLGDYTVIYSGNATATDDPYTITGAINDGYEANDAHVTATNTYAPPVITIDKEANPVSVLVNQPVTYTVTVTYEDPSEIEKLIITDDMFENMVSNSLTVTQGNATINSSNYTFEDGTLTINAFPNEGNAVTLTYTVIFNSTGTKTNTATAWAFYPPEYETPHVSDPANVTVTQTPPPPPPSNPEFGALIVDKIVSGTNASATESFAFTVTFAGSTGGIANNAGLTGTNGVYTFSLSANDTPVTFSNIPLGTTYTVTESLTAEQDNNGWSAPATASGIVSATAPVTVAMNNVFAASVAGEVDETDDDEDTGVAGDSDTLPQTGGISTSTLLGLFGLALIAIGGTMFVIFRKKNDGRSK